MLVIDMKQTAFKLKQLRKTKKLTIINLGKIIGVSKASIIKWEHGEYIPTVDHLVSLAELYNVSIDELIIRKDV